MFGFCLGFSSILRCGIAGSHGNFVEPFEEPILRIFGAHDELNLKLKLAQSQRSYSVKDTATTALA